jgi:hypothetical protein
LDKKEAKSGITSGSVIIGEVGRGSMTIGIMEVSNPVVATAAAGFRTYKLLKNKKVLQETEILCC